MEIMEFFARLLDLAPPWEVKTLTLDERTVDLHLDCSLPARMRCPSCDRDCPVTGISPSIRWRHVDTCLKKTFVHAAPAIVACPEHGRRLCQVPWAGRFPEIVGGSGTVGDRDGFLMTGGFEKWILDLARTAKDLNHAAGFAAVDPGVLRRLVRCEKRPILQAGTAAGASSQALGRGRSSGQLSLFAQGNMQFLNGGINAFGNLDLDEALGLFKKHQVHYPKGFDVSTRIKTVEFLLDGLRTLPAKPGERAEFFCKLWDSFEDFSKALGAECESFANRAKRAYFSKMLREVSAEGEQLESCPVGFALVQAGMYDEAIRVLQEHILKMPGSAVLYGRLGDAYFLRGDLAIARQCYREACLIDPSALDWPHLEDARLKELKEDLLFDYGSDPELAVEWVPAHARVDGLFEPKEIRLNAGLKEIVESYLTVEKQWRGEESPRLGARLFARGLVLCDNARNLKFIKKIDLIEVRRLMKRVNPYLFEDFLEKM